MVIKFNGQIWNSKYCWRVTNDDNTKEFIYCVFGEPRQEYIGKRIHLIKNLSGRETRIKYDEKLNKLCESNIYSDYRDWYYYDDKGHLAKKVILKDGTRVIYYYNDKGLVKGEKFENGEKTVYHYNGDC